MLKQPICKSHRFRVGFTLPEVLVVAGVIALLIAVLVPALAGAFRTSQMAKAMTNIKQLHTFMTAYSSENRDTIVPSQFDYRVSAAGGYPVKVRSDAGLAATPWGDYRYQGTWADLLWTYSGFGQKHEVGTILNNRWFYDTPEVDLYDGADNENVFDLLGSLDTPFRSPTLNTRQYVGAGTAGPTPYGEGALEEGYPGFFAANDYFNARPDAPGTPPASGRWYVTGQIKRPATSMYLVDSWAGEVIKPELAPYDNTAPPPAVPTIEADFRYNGACLMLFLDGHADPQAPWKDLGELQNDRKIRIDKLTAN